MIRITDKSQCCGCTACSAVCSHSAISFRPDGLGFPYPVVDESKCTDCGLCDRVCSFTSGSKYDEPKAFAARNKSEKMLMESRSGGVFPAMVCKVLAEGGVIYGAGYEEGFRVVHKRAITEEGCKEFSGSKYVQSDMADIMPMVRKDLENGLEVLFSGTPCQVSGLLSYLPKRLKSKLITVDIICHGVPSPYIWRDYVAYQEEKHGGTVTGVSFRDKKAYGWKAHKETFEINGNLVTDGSYTHLFYRHIMLRESCSICPYSDVKRVSDVTLGDFWGWEKSVPHMNEDDKGISLVLVNSNKGSEVIEAVAGDLDLKEVNLQDCLQPNLLRPSSRDKEAGAFADTYTRRGLKYILKRYGDQGWRYKVYIMYMNCKRRFKAWLRK